MTEEEYYGRDKFKVIPEGKHSHIGERAPVANEVTSEVMKGDGEEMVQMERRPEGIFNHPSDFTQAEDENIAKGLLAHLPLYVMATKMNCCKRLLSNHIKQTPWLAELLNQRDENILETAEYQAYRLADAGNPSMIMFILERKGKHRGWGVQDEEDGGNEEGGIFMGLIPDEDIEDNAKHVEKLKEQDMAERGLAPAVSTEGSVTGDENMSALERERQGQLADDDAAWADGMEMARKASAKKEFEENAIDVGDGVMLAPPAEQQMEDDGFGDMGEDFSFEQGF